MLIPSEVFEIHAFCELGDTPRYALNGVRLESRNGENIAIATDGRLLCVATWDDDSPGNDMVETVPAASWQSMVAIFCNNDGNPPDMTVEKLADENAVALSQSTEFELHGLTVQPLAGKFPKCESTVKRPGEHVKVRLTIALLARLATALEKMGGNQRYVEMFVPLSPNEPLLFEVDGKKVKVKAALMSANEKT